MGSLNAHNELEKPMKTLAKTLLIAMIGLSTATIATSQTMNQEGPPIEEMAADLGVSAAAFETCTSGDRPEPGERPTREEHEARLTTLADCLSDTNPSVTAELIGEVMEKYRPAPPNRG